MSYTNSQQDNKLEKWFVNDEKHAHLREINLTEGELRGLKKFSLPINFPILAISGKNGSGKSTLLALACCAYHNTKDGFKLPHRKATYYTFADFFIQHSEDFPQEGVKIRYGIAYNSWRKTAKMPNGVGIGYQERRKKKGGKWNDYGKRIKKDVAYLGLERIVPHSEKSQSRSYSKTFKHNGDNGWEDDVKNTVGHILGKKYDSFKYVSHSKYRLPIVEASGRKYSGFHMGAGENALFEVFSVLHAAKEGALIVIDEIELGLHIEAQIKLIEKLKEICLRRKIQIICTTHSKEVFENLPLKARVFIEKIGDKCSIEHSISSDHAFGKLSAKNSQELDVLVEDKVAKAILTAALPKKLRSRISIEVIGSASALSRQLAANHSRENSRKILAIFDGDQRTKEKDNIGLACKLTECSTEEENRAAKDSFKEQITYLPGDQWPERWLVTKNISSVGHISTLTGADETEMQLALENGLNEKKHSEIFKIGNAIDMPEDELLSRLCITASYCHKEEIEHIEEKISQLLDI